jgi:hypothetical protein
MTASTSPTTAPPPSASPAFAAAPRQISVGSLVNRSLSVWWRNVFRFAALTLLVFVPMVVLIAAVAYQSFAAAARGTGGVAVAGHRGLLAVMAVVFLVMLATMVVEMGALTYGTVQHLGGRPVRFGSMLAAGFRRALPLIAVGIVASVMVMAGMLLLIVPGIIIGCAVGVAIPAVVVERIGPIDAIKRSWRLTHGHRLTFFAASFVLGLVVSAANMAIQFGATLFGRLAPVAVPIAAVVYLLLVSLPTLLPAVAYHDLRAAKEGVATEDLLKVFE